MDNQSDSSSTDFEGSFEFWRGMALFIGYLYLYMSLHGLLAGLGYFQYTRNFLQAPDPLSVFVAIGATLIWGLFVYIGCIKSIALPQERVAGYALMVVVVLHATRIVQPYPEMLRLATLTVQIVFALGAVALVHWSGRYRHDPSRDLPG